MEIDSPIIDNKQLFDDDIVSDDILYLKSIISILRDRYKSLNSNFVAIRTDYSLLLQGKPSSEVDKVSLMQSSGHYMSTEIMDYMKDYQQSLINLNV